MLVASAAIDTKGWTLQTSLTGYSSAVVSLRAGGLNKPKDY
jgi:hypothetical protein